MQSFLCIIAWKGGALLAFLKLSKRCHTQAAFYWSEFNLQFGSGELFHAPQGAYPLELAVDTSQMNKEKQTD